MDVGIIEAIIHILILIIGLIVFFFVIKKEHERELQEIVDFIKMLGVVHD